MNPKARDEKQTESLKQHDSNYFGEEAEKEVFQKLKDWSEHSKIENLTIFSGWKDDRNFEKKVQREFDFILVSGDAKLVIYIEVKKKNKNDNAKLMKAKSQQEKGYNYLREKIPFAKGWRFVSVNYIGHDASNTKNDFILGPKSSFSNFFESKLELGKSSPSSSDHVSYKVLYVNIYIITFT